VRPHPESPPPRPQPSLSVEPPIWQVKYYLNSKDAGWLNAPIKILQLKRCQSIQITGIRYNRCLI